MKIVLAEIVVLIEHRDLGVRLGREDVLGIDVRLGLVVGVVAHRPREMLRIVPLGRPGGDEQLRHLVVIAILPDRRIGWSAQRLEQERDLLVLDETAHLLDGLWRAIGVIEADQVDFAADHPTPLVDHLEIGDLSATDHAIGRGGAAIGHGLPNLDLCVGDAGCIVRAGRTGAGGDCRGGGARLQKCPSSDHGASPFPL